MVKLPLIGWPIVLLWPLTVAQGGWLEAYLFLGKVLLGIVAGCLVLAALLWAAERPSVSPVLQADIGAKFSTLLGRAWNPIHDKICPNLEIR